MDIPFNSPLGFIGILMLGSGLFLVLAGFEIFSIQQVTVKTGPRTWGLGFAIALLGIILIFPEVSGQIDLSGKDGADLSDQDQPANVDSTLTSADEQDDEDNSGEDQSATWRSLTFTIPNDGIWSQPTATSYSAGPGLTDSFAWADEIIEGDFTLELDVESDFGNYGEGMVIVNGEGQSWSLGCLIFNITGYWQAVRIDSIYGDENWLVFNERNLFNDKYTMKIELTGNIANLYADDVKVATIRIPADASRSGHIGLVKYWESADVIFSNIRILIP